MCTHLVGIASGISLSVEDVADEPGGTKAGSDGKEIMHHYESLLLSHKTSLLTSNLAASTAYSHFLTRMSHLLCAALGALSCPPCIGEIPEEEVCSGMLLRFTHTNSKLSGQARQVYGRVWN